MIMELNKKFIGDIQETNFKHFDVIREKRVITIADNYDDLSDNPNNSIDIDFDFHGFEAASLERLNHLLNLTKDLESDILNCEVDIIDGVEFLSFDSELDLMEFSRHQQDQKAIASQSDDGLEILDDCSFSDISSTHAIVPTKTKDITRIKGWRNKNFVGIQDSGDSGSSLKNDDDGFGDDVELKSVHDESSEEVDSVDSPIPTGSRCGLESKSSSGIISSDTFVQSVFKNKSMNSSSPVTEDSNAEATEMSGLTFQQSFQTQSSHLLTNKNSTNQDLSSCTTTEVKSTNPSFNKKIDITHKISSLQKSRSESVQDSTSTKNVEESAQSPLTAYKDFSVKNYGDSLSNNNVYKPRVKYSLIESIARKINADNDACFFQQSTPPIKTNDETIRWHVPKEKLLCGNIYDLEVSLSSMDSKSISAAENCVEEATVDSIGSVQSHDGKKRVNSAEKAKSLVEQLPEIGAFHSSTLDEYTTNLDKLHIDFTIPKLDAADNVTHEEVKLPNQQTKLSPCKPNIKPVILIKAKTLAERKRLLEEMNNRSKRKQKLSFKLRANAEERNINRAHHYITKKKQSQIFLAKSKNKMIKKEHSNKLLVNKKWFDEHGVITYGKEKPLRCILTKNLKSQHGSILCSVNEHLHKTKSDFAIIVNVGFKRPLYREVADNIASVLNEKDTISKKAAEFAVSAIQSTNKPFTVTRFLVPIIDASLKGLVYEYKHQRFNLQKNILLKKSSTIQNVKKLNLDCGAESSNDMSEVTKKFVDENEIDSEVCKTVCDVVSFIERKNSLINITFNYDPLVPLGIEKEINMVPNSIIRTKVNERAKKTKLQRQIERLGGTYIEVNEYEETDDSVCVALQNEKCLKEHCKLGCVCPLKIPKINHCGKESCMLSCQCSITSKKQGCEIKSKIWLLPEVLRQRNTLQKKMAPVEREYHQTVIMSENKKTITIESQRKKRERKIPSKYKDEILLDYGRDENDSNLLDIIHNFKPVHNEEQIVDKKKNQTKLCSIQSLDSFLKLQKKYSINLTKENMKLCYVKIEKLKDINQFTPQASPSDNVHTKYKTISDPMKHNSKNVAVKRTGGASHNLMTANDCSRTFGVSDYYVQRNLMCKLITKDGIMYCEHSKQFSAYHSFFFHNNNDEGQIMKEDLQTEEDDDDALPNNELVCLETIEEGEGNSAGLAIDFICSLPPEIFEKQDSFDYEENSNTMPLPANNSNIKVFQNSNLADTTVDLPKRKNETIVYATLPITDTECKWWVVEMDSKKFSNLIYISDKRCLSLEEMSRATFNAAFGKTPVQIPLTKSHGNHRDIFGAYAVPGHNHLMFFGPYDVNEEHGFTAIKYSTGGYIKVPFTSTFSESEQFKKFGIDLSQNKKCKFSSHCVKAVWWYSTPKKSAPNTDGICNLDQITDKANSSNIADIYLSSSPNDNMMKSHERNDCNKEQYDTPMGGLTHISQEVTNTISDQKGSSINSTYLVVDKNSTQMNPEKVVNADHDAALGNLEPPKAGCQQKRRRKKRKRIFTSSYSKKLKKYTEQNDHIATTSMNTNHSKIFSKSKQFDNKTEYCPVDEESNCSESDTTIVEHCIEPESMNYDRSPSTDKFQSINVERVIHKPHKNFKSSHIREEADTIPISKALLQDKAFPGPHPQVALLCLTPGIGYIPVVQLKNDRSKLQNQIIIIRDPKKSYVDHQFSNVSHASDWLNKYFEKSLPLTEHLKMNWVLVKGSIIKYLQPFDTDILRHPSKILSDGSEYQGMSISIRNELERMRRNEQSHLLNKLAHIVFPEHKTERRSVLSVLQSAYYMIKAQTLMSMELSKKMLELQKRKSMLNTRLKNMLSNLPTEERKKAIELCKFIKCKSWDIDSNKIYLESIKVRELELIDEISHKSHKRDKPFISYSKWKVNNAKLINMSDHYSDLRYSPNSNNSNETVVSGESETGRNYTSLEGLALNLQQNRPKVQPTEGVLVRRKKPNSVSKPDLIQSKPSFQNNSDVINLIDSDDDGNNGKVIEIESDEDDVLWVPEKSKYVDDLGVELVPRKRQKVEFPKPKMKLPQFRNIRDNLQQNVNQDINKSDQNVHRAESFPQIIGQPQGSRNVSPVALVVSESVLQEQMKNITAVPEPEFVDVEDQYDPLNTSDHVSDIDMTYTGCSRTDPVPLVFLNRGPKFLPINKTQRINIINAPLSTLVSSVSKTDEPSQTVTNQDTVNSAENKSKMVGLQQNSLKKMLECKSMVPIGKVNFVSEIKGKQVLVKLPKTAMSLPVSKSGVSLLKNPSVRPVPYVKTVAIGAEKDNTVTLHHPSKEISETRTVQFAPMKSVNIVSSTFINGPKMHLPKARNQLRVILPKRS